MVDRLDNEPRLIRTDLPEREVYPIHEGTNRIGRSRGFDICLEDTTVSRFHCYLLREGDVVRVFEGESKNPVLVDGQPADGTALRSGHTLKVGRCEFVYEGPTPPPAARTPTVQAHATRAPRPQRPRAAALRRSSSSAGPIAACGIGLALVSLLVVVVVEVRRRPGAEPSSSEIASKVEASQRNIDELLAQMKLMKPSNEEADRLKVLLAAEQQHNAELRRELESERDSDRRGGVASSLAPSIGPSNVSSPGKGSPGGGSILFPELDGAPELAKEKPGESSSRTVVVKTSTPSVKRSAKELKDLVARLTSKIDDYGTHLIVPRTLEPDLSDLSSSAGRDAAAAVVQVYEHVRGLVRQTDGSIAANEQRKDQLLRKAAQTLPQGTPLEGSGTKKEAEGDSKMDPATPKDKQAGMYARPVGQESETNQRLLEAYGTAADIHKRHRGFLLPLRKAVLDSMGNLRDAEALAYLRQRFSDDTDTDLLKGILEPLGRAGNRESIPVLYRRMGSSSDPDLKRAIHQTLALIVGKDLGDQASVWAEWWTASQR